MWSQGESQTLEDSIGNLSLVFFLLQNVYARKGSMTSVKETIGGLPPLLKTSLSYPL